MWISPNRGSAGFTRSSNSGCVRSCGLARRMSAIRFLAASLPGAVRYLSLAEAAMAPLISPFSSGLPKASPRSRKCFVYGIPPTSANEHKLLHHFWMVEREVDRYFSTMRAAHNRHPFYLKVIQDRAKIVRCIVSSSGHRRSSVSPPIVTDGVKMPAELGPHVVPYCGVQNAIMDQYHCLRRGATLCVVQLRPIHF